MATFTVKSPTGEEYSVDAPEGSTEQDAISYVQRNHDTLKALPVTSTQQAPEQPSFWQEVKNNAVGGVQSAKDLVNGNYEDIGRTVPTPRTQALADKLFPDGSDGSFMDAVRNTRNTVPSDWSGALLEKFGNTPEGKALSVIGGLNPIYNVAGTAFNRYVVPTVSDATGIAPENIQLAALVGGTTGLKNAGKVKDPNIAMVKYLHEKVTKTGPALMRDESSFVTNPVDILKKSYPSAPKAAPVDPAVAKVTAKLQGQYKDPAELQQALNSYASTKGQALIERGDEGVQRMAEGAAQFDKGGKIATEYFGNKISVAPETVKASIYKNISPNVNYLDQVDNIVKEGRKSASPFYTEAYKSNQSVMTPVIRNILNTPQGKSALREAVADMQNEMVNPAKVDPAMTAAAKELQALDMMDSTPGGVARGLKLQTLDYVKRGFDQAIRKAKYGQNADMAEVSRLNSQRATLLNELDKADRTGAYARARATAGDYLSAREAADTGLNIMKMDREELGRMFSQYNPSDKKAFRVGVMKALREQIDKTTAAAPDGQAALGRNVAAFLQQKVMRDKLGMVLSKEQYADLVKTAQATDNLYILRNRTISGSPSARRLASMAEFDNATADAALQVVQKGATRALVDHVIGTIANKVRGMNNDTAGEVARILFETDAKKKYQIVRQLTNAAQTKTPQGRLAAAKLNAFWGMMNAMDKRRAELVPAVSATQPAQPLKINIRPERKLPEVELPKVNPGPQSNNMKLSRFYS